MAIRLLLKSLILRNTFRKKRHIQCRFIIPFHYLASIISIFQLLSSNQVPLWQLEHGFPNTEYLESTIIYRKSEARKKKEKKRKGKGKILETNLDITRQQPSLNFKNRHRRNELDEPLIPSEAPTLITANPVKMSRAIEKRNHSSQLEQH